MSNLIFWLSWPVYLVLSALYSFYRVLIVLSKPGVNLFLAYTCHVAAFGLHWRLVGWPEIDPSGSPELWYSHVAEWLTLDRAEMGIWFHPMVGLLIAALGFLVFPANSLRGVLGIGIVFAKPLPPVRKAKPPKFKVKAQRASVVVQAKALSIFPWHRPRAPQLPDELRRLLSANSSEVNAGCSSETRSGLYSTA
jgi:hypothetical protein